MPLIRRTRAARRRSAPTAPRLRRSPRHAGARLARLALGCGLLALSSPGRAELPDPADLERMARAAGGARLLDYIWGLETCGGYANDRTRSCMGRLSRSDPLARARASGLLYDAARGAMRQGDLPRALELVGGSETLRVHLRRAAGDLPGALAEIEARDAVSPTSLSQDDLADLCSVRLRLGDLPGATTACDRAAAAAPFGTPASAYASIVHAGFALATGDHPRAERQLDILARRHDDAARWPLALRLRGWLLTVRGDPTAAVVVSAARRSGSAVDAEVFELLGVHAPEPPMVEGPSKPAAPPRR